MKHTKTPWFTEEHESSNFPGCSFDGRDWFKYIDTGKIKYCTVARVHGAIKEEACSNAEFIVKAVNCHDELVLALESVLRHDENRKIELPDYLYKDIQEALEKAEGEEICLDCGKVNCICDDYNEEDD